MIVVSFFNNKGGVGKTTLSINIASFIAFKYQKKCFLLMQILNQIQLKIF